MRPVGKGKRRSLEFGKAVAARKAGTCGLSHTGDAGPDWISLSCLLGSWCLL